MDFAPRQVMVTAFYVATKVDDFYVSIARFVANLSSGTREDNEKDIRTLEPVLLFALDYNLVVYTPYRFIHSFINQSIILDVSTVTYSCGRPVSQQTRH